MLFAHGGWPYDDATRSVNGVLEVDFLNGVVLSGLASPNVKSIVAESPDVLARLCERHGESPQAFAALTVQFIKTEAGRHFEVTVQDHAGRRRTDCYDGVAGKRVSLGKHPPVSNY